MNSEHPPAQFLREEDNIHVELTYSPLDSATTMNRVKSPQAGAIVLFAGMPLSTLARPPNLNLPFPFLPTAHQPY